MSQITSFPIETQKGSGLPSLPAIIDTMTYTVTANGVTQKATHTQVKNDIKSETETAIKADLVVTGAGIPVSAPDFIGQRYIDTTNGWRYTATGTGAVSDWHVEFAYGTITVPAGGGDVFVNLGGNWINGVLTVVRSFAAADYFSDATPSTTRIDTTYDALTNAGYTDDHILSHDASAAGNHHYANPKTVDSTGIPKSATTTGFTFDDDGANTGYLKWWIIG
jgi:hypothetical protein